MGKSEREAVEAQTNVLSNQIQSIQDEMERIVSVVEQTGGSIMGLQGIKSGMQSAEILNHAGAEALVERQPMIKVPADPVGALPSYPAPESLKKKKIIVSLEQKNNNNIKSRYRVRQAAQQA